MIVMPANNTYWVVHYWAGLYGGLGHLYGPGRRTPPFPHIPYVLDNGAFGAWKNGSIWDQKAFLAHVEYYAFNALRPDWVVVPDVVMDAELTLARFRHWAPILQGEYNLQLAIAVQDGMDADMVKSLSPQPEVVFVGGGTVWKWATVGEWTQAFPRVHCGRVNTKRQLELCAAVGVESCDGTGWFRGRSAQIAELGHFLRQQAGSNDATAVDHVVYHSRLNNMRNACLPLEAA